MEFRKDIISWCAGISALMILLPPIKDAANFGLSSYGLIFSLEPNEEVHPIRLIAQIVFVWFIGLCIAMAVAKPTKEHVKPNRVVAKTDDEWFQVIIQNYWNGAEPLWKAYWLLGVVGGTIGALLVEKMTGLSDPNWMQKLLPYIFILYAGWSTVAIWRCANNASKPIWKFLARGVVAFGVAALVVNLINAMK